MKKCNKCFVDKSLSEYHKDRTRPDGYSYSCKSCKNENGAKWYSNNKEHRYEVSKQWIENNRERVNEKAREWRKANPEKAKASTKRWREANPDKMKAAYTNWAKDNPTSVLIKTSRRRASKVNATPKWSESDLIRIVYQKAKELGAHVDHIVPLKSDKVCGLHCWANLQILPPEVNTSKGNREWPDMP